MRNIFKKRFLKVISAFMAVEILAQTCAPGIALALTSGPSQPEVQAFEPMGTSEMVDLFTGDFTYNIPLFELPGPDGGYPFNLAYHSGITMDQEASWVGLGWSLNPGAINRQMRGVPDEFSGDVMEVKQHVKNNVTVGASLAPCLEIFGKTCDEKKEEKPAGTTTVENDNEKLNIQFGLTLYHNTYKGIGYSFNPTAHFNLGTSTTTETTNNYEYVGSQNPTSPTTSTALGGYEFIGQTQDEIASSGEFIDLDFNFDSQKGISINPSLSLSKKTTELDKSFKFGFSVNSRAGLQGLSLSGSLTNRNWDNAFAHSSGNTLSGLTSLYTSTASYVPSSSRAMQTVGATIDFKVGAEVQGFFGNSKISGFVNTQYLVNNGGSTYKQIYGYNRLEDGLNDLLDDEIDNPVLRSDIITDFDREKDGIIYKDSRNLAVPRITHDIYNVTGQGVGGNFRPYRSEIISVSDQLTVSKDGSGSLGFDVGGGVGAKLGINLNGTYKETIEGAWGQRKNVKKDLRRNNLSNLYRPHRKEDNNLREPFYYKNAGESTTDSLNDLDYIGGYDAVLPTLGLYQSEVGGVAGGLLGGPGGASFFLNKRYKLERSLSRTEHGNITGTFEAKNFNPDKPRESRNQLNQQTLVEDAGAFKVLQTKYYPITGNTVGMARDYNYRRQVGNGLAVEDFMKDHHVAAFTTTTPSGTRYVYGLPANNNRQLEYQFSVDYNDHTIPNDPALIKVEGDGNEEVDYKVKRTNKYYDKKSIPAFVHAHMLSSVLGSDYVDLDNQPGPSIGDLGYWVDFDYARPTEVYKWRAPFTGANYLKGKETDLEDDMGTFMYGERENWYMRKVETKSHVALFHISQRQDARGAGQVIQNPDGSNEGEDIHGAHSYKLDSIQLYSRPSYEKLENGEVAEPIKTVYLEYDYSLCPHVENNEGNGVDKYGNSVSHDSPENINASKGKLTLTRVWFKNRKSNRGKLNPYRFDYSDNNPYYHKHLYDRWGQYKYDGTIGGEEANVNRNLNFPYLDQSTNPVKEENLKKNVSSWSMTKINLPSGASISVDYESDDYAYVQDRVAMQMFKIVKTGASVNGDLAHDDSKLYFDLETPFSNTSTNVEFYKEAYFSQIEDDAVYFKTRMNIKDAGYEPVNGYSKVKSFGFDDQSIVNGKLTRGYIELEKVKHKKKDKWHPMAYAGWQYMKFSRPELISGSAKKLDNENLNKNKTKERLGSLLSNFSEIKQRIVGFYNYADTKDWCKKIDLSESYIRLNSPDRIKKGGGLRVKQITLNDHWSQSGTGEDDSYYGQVYDYTKTTTIAGEQRTISSGVASYEPTIGGDENAVRRLKRQFENKQFLMMNNLVSTEHPYNESYYPSPVVGYSSVTVKSLATHYEGNLNSEDPDQEYGFPSGISTTGAVKHEFYTAKDFPVISKETDMFSKNVKAFLPIPLIGTLSKKSNYASQGYSIELNDMHGRPKKVSNYGQEKNGDFQKEPYSYVEYKYLSHEIAPGKFVLDNVVKTLTALKESNENPVPVIEDRILGQDYDFFTDTRQSATHVNSGGLSFDLDITITPLPIPVPSGWPKYNNSVTNSYLAVANKVIRKSGILSEVISYDQGAKVTAKNEVYDAQTGQVVLTSTKNSFDEDVYNYNIPAHLAYDGMGAAYKNIGYTFKKSFTDLGNDMYSVVYGTWADPLVPGDEILVGNNVKGHYVKKEGSNLIFSFTDEITSGDKDCMIVRSGRRNHLTASAGNIVALTNPFNSLNDTMINCSADIPETMTESANVCRLIDQQEAECIQELMNELWDKFKSNGQQIPTYLEIPTDNECYGWVFHLNPSLRTDEIGVISDGQDAIRFVGHSISGPGAIFQGYSIPNNKINDIVVFRNPSCKLNDPTHIFFDAINRYGHVVQQVVIGSISARETIQETKNKIVLGQNNDQVLSYTQNDVLSASATTYTDNWPLDYSQLRGQDASGQVWNSTKIDELLGLNSFETGSQGIWRPQSSYVYNGKRKQGDFLRKSSTSAGTNNIDLSKDGVMDSVPLFDWDNTHLYVCNPEWTKVNTINQYNAENNAIEEENAIGTKSSALYGYNGQLATAVAGNASQNEILFESFEEYSANQVISNPTQLSGSNLDLLNTGAVTGDFIDHGEINIISANDSLLIVDLPYDALRVLTNVEFKVHGTQAKSMTKSSISGTYTGSQLPYPDQSITDRSIIELSGLETDGVWFGKLSYDLKVPATGASGYSVKENAGSSAIKAHTGKKYLQTYAGNFFQVNRLKFQPNKKYVIQAWTSLSNFYSLNLTSYNVTNANNGHVFDKKPGVTVQFLKNGNVIQSTTVGAVGSIINKWQRIEGTVLVPYDFDEVRMRLETVEVQSFGITSTFYDDIRIFPNSGSMASYVYDPVDYRLQSTLDANNYATFYYYDASGSLYLTKRETAKGIMTLSENQSFVKPSGN